VSLTYFVGSDLSLTQYLVEALLEQFLEPFSMLLGGIIQRAPAKGISGEIEGSFEVVI
jgi:hypothetical protein